MAEKPGVLVDAPSDLAPFVSPPGASEPPDPAAKRLLAIIESPGTTADRRRLAILEAESVPFDPADANRLKGFLRSLLDRSYSTKDPDERVAVSSAVRKYVSLLKPDELAGLAELIRAERKAPPTFEMEVAKMVVRKLTAVLPEDTAALAPLAEELMDVVRAYASPRALVKRYQGAAALDAALGVTMISATHTAEVAALIGGLDAQWFREVVAQRAREIATELEGRFPSARRERAVAALSQLADAAVKAG
ncbi:MAG: hypothetical protein U0746_08945 [Gemmataceae bacterium]